MSHLRTLCVALALVGSLGFPDLVLGQDDEDREDQIYVRHFEPPSYLVFSLDDDNALFEAHLRLPIVFYQNVGRVLNETYPGENTWAFRAEGFMAVRLRLMKELSLPVRTPSYMPAPLDFWAYNYRRTQSGDQVHMLAFRAIPWGHHSNGQDGCLFTTQTRNDALDCVPFPQQSELSDSFVNRTNGSFSTNYSRVGAYYKRSFLDGDGVTSKFFGGGLEFETHPTGYGPGDISPELRSIYPPHRATLVGEFGYRGDASRQKVYVRGSFQYQWGETYETDVPQVEAELELSWRFAEEWGLRGAAFYGPDDYNLAFLRKRTYFTIGVSRFIDRLETFGSRQDDGND